MAKVLSPGGLCVTSSLVVGGDSFCIIMSGTQLKRHGSFSRLFALGPALFFKIWPPLSTGFVPFLLPHTNKLMCDVLQTKILAMVAKEVIVSVPQEVGPRFCCNLFLVTKVTGVF